MTNSVNRLSIASTGDITINPLNDLNLKGEDLYSAVLGNRTYTAQRFVTSGETLTASVNKLDLVVQDVVFGELGLWQRVAGTLIRPATYHDFVITDSGMVGIGTDSPTTTLDVQGGARFGNTSTDLLEFVARIKEGTSIIPQSDISVDLGAPGYRFNNIYVANINSNAQLTATGQAIFTYEPPTTTYAESTVRINPTEPLDQSFLLGIGVYGYQRAGFDTDGDLSIGYSGLNSIPTTNYPFNVYGHNTTQVSFIDASGNTYFAGNLGLGTQYPTAKLHIVGTTEQLRLAYDAENYLSFAINSSGLLTLSDSTSATLATLGSSGITFNGPTTFSNVGNVSVANNLVLTNQTSANISSYGPLYIESGENFENNDLTLRTYGTGNLALDLTGTGYVHLTGSSPSIVFNTRTAGDTDYWMGVQEDSAGTDDDKFIIGKGTVLGTEALLTLTPNGSLGIGTTSPTEKLHVVGGAVLGSTSTDLLTLNARLSSGSSVIPAVDLGSDLGHANYRFNNIYVANINSNAQMTSAGQAVFTYSPQDTTWTQSTVRINPTTAPVGSWLLGVGVAGNQVAGINAQGGAYFASNVLSEGTISNSSLTLSTTNITSTGGINLNLADAAGTYALSIRDSSNSNLFGVNSLGAIASTGTTASFSLNGGGSGDAFTITNTGNGASFRVNDTSSDTSPFLIDASGNVGIGVVTPTTKLDVNGTIKATGLILPTGAQAGYILTTDGSGNTSWVNSSYSGGPWANTGLNVFLDDSSFLVGIGTQNPDAKLSIVGDGTGLISTWYNSSDTQTVAFGESFVDFNVPAFFGGDGDTKINGSLLFEDSEYSKISSIGDLYITSGTSLQSSNIYLSPFGEGEIFTTSNLLVDGDVEASGTFVSDAGFDLSEVYETIATDLEPGDLVMVTEEMVVDKANFMNRDSLVGIVSTKPGFTLGGGYFAKNAEVTENAQVLIALAGRVPVKVSLENGEIKPGDALTIGSINGVAVKARTNGMIVARALEKYTITDKLEGKSTIIAMVQTNWWQSSQGQQDNQEFTMDWEIANNNLESLSGNNNLSGLNSIEDTNLNEQTNPEGAGNINNTFHNLTVTGDFTAGLIKLDSMQNSLDVLGASCYNTQTNSTNQSLCKDQTLYLQKGLSGNIDMFNGRIEFNPNGTVKAKSVVADTVKAEMVEAKEFRATQNVGTTKLRAGTLEVFVENPSTKSASKIFVTPNSPVAISVKNVKEGNGFTIEIKEALEKELSVDWWLIN